jgi:hypothetical protein
MIRSIVTGALFYVASGAPLNTEKYTSDYQCTSCVGIVDLMRETSSTFEGACDAFFGKGGASCAFENAAAFTDSSADPRDSCRINGFCPESDLAAFSTSASGLDIRVSKAYGSRGYDKIRLSVISNSSVASSLFSYSQPFKYRWTQNYLNTGIVSVKPGQSNVFKIGTEEIKIFVPAEGDGARGVIIADPCFTRHVNHNTCRFEFLTRCWIASSLCACIRISSRCSIIRLNF